jgi:hypothetical protein
VTAGPPLHRPPAVAGRFYPAEPSRLRALIDACLAGAPREARAARGALVPHAGIEYSGRCAGQVFGRLALPPVIVVLAPNHTGRWGAAGGAGLWRSGAFATPLGDVPVAAEFAARLEDASPLVGHDPLAHRSEHAIEVELPFLAALGGVSLVPLVLAWDDWARCAELAAVLADLIAGWTTGVLLLASSDLSHYESAGIAASKDRLALAAIERLDGRALLETCRREHITMCGRAPAAVVLEASRRLGARRAEVVDYRHSGQVTGDHDRVVGYAGVVID